MFDEDNNDDDNESRIVGVTAIRDLRTQALIMFGRYIAKQNGSESDDEIAASRLEYLSVEETEQIVREHAVIQNDQMFGVGGNSEADVQKTLRRLMSALVDRIMSNVLREGVKKGFLECFYDDATNNFAFGPTEDGKKYVEQHEGQKDKDNGSAGN